MSKKSFAALLSGAATIALALLVPSLAAAQPRPFAYVTNSGGNSVFVVDTATNSMVANIHVGFSPTGIAITPNGAFAYVANNESRSVSVISTATDSVVATVPVPNGPNGVAITPNGAFAYVTNTGGGNVSVISTATNTVVATVEGVITPERVAITPDGAFAYVTNGVGTVTVIKTSSNQIAGTIPIDDGPGGNPDNPFGIAITPNGGHAYVANFSNNEVAVINTATNAVVDELSLTGGPSNVAITPDGRHAYVSSKAGNTVTAIDTATDDVVSTIAEAAEPWGIAIAPDGGRAYVANFGSDNISVIDTASNSIAGTIVDGPESRPNSIALTPPIERGGTTPPKVEILSGPPKESARKKATFTFRGVTGGSYECAIDKGAWTPCASGQSFGPLPPGDHRFQVRETLNGVTGPAASYRWTIDLPKACVLRVARARVYVAHSAHRVRLVIHYTSYRPAQVSVSYDLVGAAGPTAFGSTSARFRVAGVFRDPELLDSRDSARVRSAKRFKVHFSIPRTPRSCGRYYTKRLTIPKKFSGRTVWFQSDSTFAP